MFKLEQISLRLWWPSKFEKKILIKGFHCSANSRSRQWNNLKQLSQCFASSTQLHGIDPSKFTLSTNDQQDDPSAQPNWPVGSTTGRVTRSWLRIYFVTIKEFWLPRALLDEDRLKLILLIPVDIGFYH